MPYVCVSPVSTKIDGASVKIQRSDRVADELAEKVLKTHPHALTRVVHADHNCDETCTHHSHAWNQPAAQSAAKPVPARKPAPEDTK